MIGGVPSIFINNYCQNVTPLEFPEILEKIISNKSFRGELITNGKLFMKKYLTNIDQSSESVLEFLKHYPDN